MFTIISSFARNEITKKEAGLNVP